MQSWKPVATVFQGGTQQIAALKGKRVRARSSLLSARLYDPIHNRQETTTVHQGAIGFVANPQGDGILVAFAKQPNLMPVSLESLMRSGAFLVVIVNSPTFKAGFDIEA